MIVDVMDLNFKTLNFNKIYDKSRYSKAQIIYYSKDVKIKNVEKQEKGNDSYYKIKSYVIGNYSNYNVDVEVKNTTVISSSCTCPDAENGNVCKHVLATCMEIVEPHFPSTEEGKKKAEEIERKKLEELERKKEYERKYSNALELIERYKKQNTRSIYNSYNEELSVKELYEKTKLSLEIGNKSSNAELATEIKLEPKLEFGYDGCLDVSFKIGKTTMYMLKDINLLKEACDTGNVLELGKKLRFYPKVENFCDEDKELFKYILSYADVIKYQRQLSSSMYYSSYSISTKFVRVFNDKIDEFFDLVKHKTIYFGDYKQKDAPYTFTDKKINPTVSVTKIENSEVILNLNMPDYNNYIESSNNVYILSKGEIYKLDKSENLLDLLKIFGTKKELVIPEDRFLDFSTYILPKIEKYLEIEESEDDNNVKDNKIYINKLASKVYLDLDNKDNITLDLKFCYLDKEFNVLDKNYREYVEENNIKRNLQDEKDVLTRLFLDGFELENGKSYFVLKDEEAMYEFLSDKIEGYMNDFEVLVTDKFKNKKVRAPKITNIGIKVDNGLLEIDLSNIDIDMEEMKKVMQSYNIKKKYHKLKNGDFLNLQNSKELELLNDMSNTLDIDFSKIDNNKVKLPVNRSLYLEKLLNKNNEISTEKNDEYNNLVNNIGNKNFSDKITISKNFENVLRSYQKVGYKWLKVLEEYGFGGILADDMGLGKTLQVIALLESNLDSKDKGTSIVVCPSSLVFNWKSEVEKWCPKIKILTISGDAITRRELIEKSDEYDVIVTSYDLLKRDIEEYEGKNFKYIIADEAQYIKNSSTQNATALKSLNGQVRYALTGTPIENSIAELWSIFDFIMPGYLYSYNKFKKKFEAPIIKEENKEALKRLKTMIEPFVLRRIKNEVLTELPDKNITVMKNEMTKEQEKLYVSYLAKTKMEMNETINENGFEKSKLKILSLLIRLRQICCHPGLFIENYNEKSGKLMQCMDIINEAIASGHRILLFSQYTTMFEIIEKELQNLGINYYKLTGSTPTSKRIDMVESFNKNENIKIFLISLKAGGTGLNLTGADMVIHYDPWWNLSSENQATDRAYRIGQKNSVQVYKLITTNSIEEKINKLQEKKAKISEELLSTEETFINTLSKEEIMALFE